MVTVQELITGDETVVEIYTYDDIKYIKFLCYGNYNDENKYDLYEYCWFSVPLESVMSYGKITDYENHFGQFYKQYVSEYETNDELINVMSNYCGNEYKTAILYPEELNENTSDGIYAVKFG